MSAKEQLQVRAVPALLLSGASRGTSLLGFCAIALRRCGIDGSSTAVKAQAGLYQPLLAGASKPLMLHGGEICSLKRHRILLILFICLAGSRALPSLGSTGSSSKSALSSGLSVNNGLAAPPYRNDTGSRLLSDLILCLSDTGCIEKWPSLLAIL